MKYRFIGTTEVDDSLLAVLEAVDDPCDEMDIATLIEMLLVNESGGLIYNPDVLVEKIE